MNLDEIYVLLLEAIADDDVQDQINQARRLRKECRKHKIFNKMMDLAERILIKHTIDVAAKLKEIEKYGLEGDHEKAHNAEDDLFRDVLTNIAGFCTDDRCRKLAEDALLSCEIEFERWTA